MPPYIPGQMRYISNSQLELLLECSWKHKLKYLDDIPEPTNEHLIIGASVHKGVEAYRIAQMENRAQEWTEYQRNEIVLKAMNDEFDQIVFNASNGIVPEGVTSRSTAGIKWSRGMSEDIARKLAKQLLAVYFYKPAESDISGMSGKPLFMLEEPISIEEDFLVPIPKTNNWYAKGRFDMRTKNGLVDLKTSKSKYTQRDMDKKTQPSFYTMALLAKTGEFVPDFYFHILIKPTRSVWAPDSGDPPPTQMGAYKAAVQRTRRSVGEIQWFVDLLRQQVRQIELGTQVPRQNADWCDYCAVAHACKPWLGGGHSPDDLLEFLRAELRGSAGAAEAADETKGF